MVTFSMTTASIGLSRVSRLTDTILSTTSISPTTCPTTEYWPSRSGDGHILSGLGGRRGLLRLPRLALRGLCIRAVHQDPSEQEQPHERDTSHFNPPNGWRSSR